MCLTICNTHLRQGMATGWLCDRWGLELKNYGTPEQRHEPNSYYKRCVKVCQTKAANQTYTLLLVQLSTVLNTGHHCCIFCVIWNCCWLLNFLYLQNIWSAKQKYINSSPITGLQGTAFSISQSDSHPLNQPACTKSHSHSLPLHQTLDSLFLMTELG
jgi:hypothetical protein